MELIAIETAIESFTEEQKIQFEKGMRETDRYIPSVSGYNKAFLILGPDQKVRGIFFVFPSFDSLDPPQIKSVEIGIRMFDSSPIPIKLMVEILLDIFTRCPAVTVRVYRFNKRIKRLLQRGGFTYVGGYVETDKESGKNPKTVEQYVLTQSAFYTILGLG